MSRIGNLIKKAQAYKGQEFRQPKMFVPSGMIVPETAKNTMARQLYQAGIITKDDYEKMLGVVYDGDFKLNEEDLSDEAFSAFEEEFKLSELSEYYDDYGSDSEVLESSTARVEPSSATSVSETERNNKDLRIGKGTGAAEGDRQDEQHSETKSDTS